MSETPVWLCSPWCVWVLSVMTGTSSTSRSCGRWGRYVPANWPLCARRFGRRVRQWSPYDVGGTERNRSRPWWAGSHVHTLDVICDRRAECRVARATADEEETASPTRCDAQHMDRHGNESLSCVPCAPQIHRSSLTLSSGPHQSQDSDTHQRPPVWTAIFPAVIAGQFRCRTRRVQHCWCLPTRYGYGTCQGPSLWPRS